MRQGFTLIELMLATFIAGLILTGLFAALQITTRIQVSIDNDTNMLMRLATVKRQMERDIGGFFAPRPVVDQPEPEEKEGETEGKADQKKEGEKNEPAKPAEKQAEKKPPAKPTFKEIQQVFKLVTKEGKLDLFTFITDNAMQTYWGTKQARPVPRAARVIYRLKPDEKHKNSFSLTRQEGYELDIKAYEQAAGTQQHTQAKEFELIEGIKSLEVSLYAAKIKEPEPKKAGVGPGQEKAAQEEKKDEVVEFKKVHQWQYPLSEDQQKEKQETALLPRFVEITVVLWDNRQTSERSFTFTLPIVVQAKGYKVQKPQQPAPPASAGQPKAPGKAGQPGPPSGSAASGVFGMGVSRRRTEITMIEEHPVPIPPGATNRSKQSHGSHPRKQGLPPKQPRNQMAMR